MKVAIGFLRWAATIPAYLCVAVWAWLRVPAAVDRAEPWDESRMLDVTPATRMRFLSLPKSVIPEMFRLRKEDRWLELHDDQILPPGVYESEIADIYRDKGWRATSIAFLRRNLAHGWCCRQGASLIGTEHRWGYGVRGTSRIAGHWLGFVDAGDRVLWQWIGSWHIGRLSIEVNTGYVIRDLFDDAWYVGRPARWRLFSLRLRDRARFANSETGDASGA